MKALQKLLILGSGKMGGSLLKGLISNNELNFDISVVEPNLIKDNYNLISANKIKHYQSINNIKETDFDTVLFAVKPQVISEVCSGVLENLDQKKTFSIISILAGTKVETFESYFDLSPIIRAMPNLAVSEGSGVTALYGNNSVNKALKETTDKIFSGVGEVIWVDNEDMMDVVTSTSDQDLPIIFF